ncbi:hypothetical protein D3C83_93780 [compost metagenome]
MQRAVRAIELLEAFPDHAEPHPLVMVLSIESLPIVGDQHFQRVGHLPRLDEQLGIAAHRLDSMTKRVFNKWLKYQ